MFKEKFTRLCVERGIAPTTVCTMVGLSTTAYSKWEETSVPRRATLIKIADYFGITVDELISDDPAPTTKTAPPEEPEEPLSEVKRRLHALVDTADEDEVERMLVMMEALIEAERKKRGSK